MDKSIKKTILSTSLVTFGIFAIIIYVALLVISWFFPILIADLSMQVGNKGLACSYYNLDYDKTGDLNSAYKAVSLAINSNQYDKIEKYYVKFEKHEDYLDYIIEINIINSKTTLNDYAKSFILNEDNYLKSNYVKALIKNGKKDQAIKYVIDNFRAPYQNNFDLLKFEDCLKYTMTSEVYLFDLLIYDNMSVEDINIFNSTHNDKYGSILLKEMYGLSTIYVDIFDKAKDEYKESNLKTYVFMCGNMALKVCENIIQVYDNAVNKDVTINQEFSNTYYQDVKLIINYLKEEILTLMGK